MFERNNLSTVSRHCLPGVSVIVTNYNYQYYVGRCIRSILSQSFENFEIVLVDDASSDRSTSVYKIFTHDARLRIIVNSHNRGLGFSCNVGVETARGRYIVRVDADDFVHRDFLYCLDLYLNLVPQAHAVACDYFEVSGNDEKGRHIAARNHPIACGIMFRAEVLWKMGFYNPKLSNGEDKEIMARFSAQEYRLDYLEIPLYRYYRHDESITAQESDALHD